MRQTWRPCLGHVCAISETEQRAHGARTRGNDIPWVTGIAVVVERVNQGVPEAGLKRRSIAVQAGRLPRNTQMIGECYIRPSIQRGGNGIASGAAASTKRAEQRKMNEVTTSWKPNFGKVRNFKKR